MWGVLLILRGSCECGVHGIYNMFSIFCSSTDNIYTPFFGLQVLTLNFLILKFFARSLKGL